MTQQHWGNRVDYFFTVLGWAMGTGPMFRGPFLWIRSGGGAFFVPYILCTLLCAVPLVYLEMVLGQYSQAGLINTFNFCPPLKGVGVGALVMMAFYALYYPIYMTWSLLYFFHSFQAPLPWTTCNNDWNTPDCHERGILGPKHFKGNGSLLNSTMSLAPFNLSGMPVSTSGMAVVEQLNVSEGSNSSTIELEHSAADEFWSYKILQMTEGISQVGGMNWHMLGTHTLLFIIFFLCLVKGVKILGKVVYVTYVGPFLLLLAILVRMCTLPGGLQGISFMWQPNLEKLADPNVWLEGWQVALYSYGIAMGVIITLTGHNRFNRPILKNLLVLVPANVAGEIFAIMTVLAIIGFVSTSHDMPMEDFQFSGMKLSFIAFSEALSTLPLPQVWSFVFFITAVMLGMDSVLPAMEVLMGGLEDLAPRLRSRRLLLTALVVIPCFLPGLLFCTKGGIYFVTIVDWFAVFPAMLLIAVMECVAVAAIYGWDRICEDIETMTGSRPPLVMKYCWLLLVPLQLLVILANSCYSYRPPRYGTYEFPPLANVIGWMISLASVLPIPVVLLWSLRRCVGKGWRQRLRAQLQPHSSWRKGAIQACYSSSRQHSQEQTSAADDDDNTASFLPHQHDNGVHRELEIAQTRL